MGSRTLFSQPVSISTDRLCIGIAPQIGGSLFQFAAYHGNQWVDLCRHPGPDEAVTLGNTACFIMGPSVGRTPNRQFNWHGKPYSFSHLADPATGLHGIMRQLPWTVVEKDETLVSMVLRFRQEGGYSWPSDFDAKLTYELDGSMLTVRLHVANVGSECMPFSSGTHMMFLKREKPAHVQYDAEGWYPVNRELLVPLGHCEVLPDELRRSHPAEIGDDWDHCLTGWSGPAVISWPDDGLAVVIKGHDGLSSFLQCWSGGKNGVFALEPQTAPANAVNLRDPHSGLCVLWPKDSGNTYEVQTSHTFEVRTS